MVQKYLPARSFGEAQVSRSSSRVSLRSQTSSQLQCRGFPPKLNTRAVRGEPFILAYTGIRRNSGSGGIFFSLLEVMSSLVMETARINLWILSIRAGPKMELDIWIITSVFFLGMLGLTSLKVVYILQLYIYYTWKILNADSAKLN